jgi:hypothetical protein
MFVNVGTIVAASNEAQLAGVMAHEMAHVYMQHSAKQMQKNTVPSLISALGQIAGSMIGGIGGAVASAGGQLGGGMLSMKYSRSDEAQADAVGAIIMYRAGYDPRALADFFSKMSEEGGEGGPQFLSDHPNPGNREQAIQKEIESWPPKQFRTSSAAFTQARQRASSVRLYTAQEIAEGAKSGKWMQVNKQNGAVFKAPEGVKVQPTSGSPSQPGANDTAGVAPSSRMVTENLGPLTIARPTNWEVFTPQQQGQSVTIAPRAGVSDQGVGYGVVINGVQPQNGSGNIDQMTSEIVRALQGQGGDLQTVGSPQSITVGGVRGRAVMMESTSPLPGSNGQAQRERDWLVTLPQRDGSVMYLVFVAPRSEFQNFKPTFDSMLRSLQF